MSYCKFENTANDLEDCLETMGENDFDKEKLNSYEKAGHNKLIELCIAIACDFGNCVEDD